MSGCIITERDDSAVLRRVGKALSPLAPLCKGELLLQCEALPTIEGLPTEVSAKRKWCGRKAIPQSCDR